MFFIFGWGRTKKNNLGPVFENHCTHCNNDKYWNLVTATKWFTLFYIPVIPYETQHYVLCPVCEYGIKLDSQKFEELKPIAENNNALVKGEITQAQYLDNLKQLPSGSSKTENPKNNDGVCVKCGHQNKIENKFCKNCGLKLV